MGRAKYIHVLWYVVLSAMLVDSAMADSHQASPAEGFYLGGNLGLVHYDHDDFFDSGALVGSSFDDDSFSVSVYGGYTLNRWLSVELGLTSLGSYAEEGKGINDDDEIVTSLSAITTSLVTHIPLSQTVDLFMQAGIGLATISQSIDYDVVGTDIEEDESDTGPAGQLGVGLIIDLSESVPVQLKMGYQSFFFETDVYNVDATPALVSDEKNQRVDHLYLGAHYRF